MLENVELADDVGNQYVVDKPLNEDRPWLERMMSNVYLAHFANAPERQCVIKTPNPDFGGQNGAPDLLELRELFRKEIALQRELGVEGGGFAQFHGFINEARVIDLDGDVTLVPAMAMEFLHGEVLNAAKPMPPYKVFVIVEKILKILKNVHQRGIILRDLKLDHVVVDGDVNIDGIEIVPANLDVKLLDLGLAGQGADFEAERDYALWGTPEYYPPELVQKQHQYLNDPRRDLYALGVIAYAMVTGDLPIKSDKGMVFTLRNHLTINPGEIGHWHQVGRYFYPAPLSFRKFIMKLLAKNPEGRYKNSEEALEDLRKVDRVKFIASEVEFGADAVVNGGIR